MGGRCQKKVVPIKALHFSILRECKINLKNHNMKMYVRNSSKKTKYF